MQAVHQKGGFLLYVIARFIIGALFFINGAQKLFGWFGGSRVDLVSQMGLAGLIEFFCGIAIAAGFFTLPALFIASLLMVAAYVTVHFPQGLAPWANGGELALLYLASFLALLSYHMKTYRVDWRFWRRRR